MKQRFTKNALQEAKITQERSLIIAFFVVLLFFLLVVRLAYLSLYEHHYYMAVAAHNHNETIPIVPLRGMITDCHGVVLAKNQPSYSLYLVPLKATPLAVTLKRLQTLIHLSDNDITHFYRIRAQYRSLDEIPIKTSLTEEEADTLAVHHYELKGVLVKTTFTRVYPLKEAAVSVVGYIGRSNDATGIERYADETLRGTPGYDKFEMNAQGQMMRRLQHQPAIPGHAVRLTIDSRLQQAAFDALGNDTGALVALDPKTGAVLALVSTPAFDPNTFVSGLSQQAFNTLQNGSRLFNRALRGLYSPASTVKPFIALQGLATHTITPETEIEDPGFFMLPNNNHVFHDWVKEGHGTLNLTRAIRVSCDTYFYSLAEHLGIQLIDHMLAAFGFGTVPAIDLPDAATGTLPSPLWKESQIGEKWFPGDTLMTGIGQGYLTATPLQLADATATLANRGLGHTPFVIADAKQTPLSPIILPDTVWQTVITAMEDVIKNSEGTGFRFGRDAPYTVAAKTGTAQVVSRANAAPEQLHLRNNSVFIAFAPVDQPRIALAVVVEHNATAPLVARRVMDAFFAEEATP